MGNDVIKFRANLYKVFLKGGDSFVFTDSKDLFVTDGETLQVWVNGNKFRTYSFQVENILYTYCEDAVIEE